MTFKGFVRVSKVCIALALAPVVSLAQQTPLLEEVRTVAAADAAVPVEHEFQIANAGNYQVTLTDLGATDAPLAAVRLAVTRAGTIVGTPLTAPGSLTFAATASTTYTIRITGRPGADLGSGLFRVTVRDSAGTTTFANFVGMLALPSGTATDGQFLLEQTVAVGATGAYTLSLNDLNWPQPMPTLLLALVEEGGPLIAALNASTANPATQSVTLDSTRTYRLFGIAVPAVDVGGIYTIDLRASGGGSAIVQRTVPVGGVAALDSIALAAGPHVLTLSDLNFPAALATSSALLVRAGQTVVQTSTPGDATFTAAAGPHEIYAFGAANATENAGSLSVRVAPQGGAGLLSSARAIARPGSGVSAFTYDAPIGAAATYRVRLADYQFPSGFAQLRLAAVQNNTLFATQLTAPGNFEVNAAQGRVQLLAFAQTATQGLLGVDVTPTAAGSVAFETTQGVGGAFLSRKVNVAGAASYRVTATDLGFPAPFANLSTAVTRGADRIGLVFGGGSFNFAATPGSYFVNVIATPDATEKAGTYALSTTPLPPPPVVTMSATPTSLPSGGGAVDITWAATNATSCMASDGWSGARAVNGTARTAAITVETKFTLTCTGDGGSTPQSVTVAVASASSGGGGGGGGGAFELGWLAALAALVAARFVALRPRIALRAIALPLLVGSALVVAGCGGASARFERSMERGEEYLNSGDLDKAKVEFRNAMQISPKAPDARYHGGLVAERRQDFREALVLYKQAIDLQPDYPEARARYARIFVFGGSPERALELVSEGLTSHPDNVDLLIVRGAARLQLKQPVDARGDAQRALKLAPANEDAVALLASIERTSGDRKAAIAALEKALPRVPKSANLRRILATLATEEGDFAAAQKHLAEAVRLEPTLLALRYELANLHVRMQQPELARGVLEQAVKALPKSDDAKLVLANFFLSQGSREAGEAVLRTHIKADPDNLELRLGLAALLERAGAGAAAVVVYQEIVERDGAGPDGFTARNRIAAYEASQGRGDEALRMLQDILGENPRDVAALVLRARLSIENGNPGTAVADLRAVLRESPSSGEAYGMLARAHLANGEPMLAEESLRKAIEVSPSDSMLRVELAQLLTRSARAPAAVAMLEESVRRAPTDATVREALVRAYVETGAIDEAIRGAEDLKVLLPHSPMGSFLRGQIAQLEGRADLAEKEYTQALTAAPRAIDVLAALTRVQLAAGRGSEAAGRVARAIEALGESPALRNLAGELNLGLREPSKAGADFERAIALNPKWWLPYRNLAIARHQQKDVDGAIRAIEAGRKALPSEIPLAVELASLYELQKRIDDAVRVYEDVLVRQPRHAVAANNLAKLLLAHRNDEKSLARAAVVTAPFASSPDPALLDTYGWTLYRRGDIAGAQDALQRAFAKAPDSGSVRYHLALVQVRAGEVEKAIDNLEIAVAGPRAFTGVAEARTLLRDLKAREG